MTKQERTARLLAGALFSRALLSLGSGLQLLSNLPASMLKQFHLTRLQVGIVPGVQAITAGVFGLLVGWLLDRVPAQIVMAVGAVSTAVGIVMMSQAGSLNGLLAGSAVTGIGMIASTVLPASMVIANWFGERRGTALGITLAGMELGGMVITMLAGYLVVAYGWRFAYAVLAIPLVVVAVPLYLIFVRTRPEQVAQSGSAGNRGLAESVFTLPGLEVNEALRTRAFLDAGGVPVLLHVRVRRQASSISWSTSSASATASGRHNGSQFLAGIGGDRQARYGSAG